MEDGGAGIFLAARPVFESIDSHLYRNSCGPSIAGALAFVVALAFAGRVRPRIDLFLDKCCIHQVDDELKGRGIRAIPEVLRRSDSLLLVYTEDYFRRLWCVLEFALFCDTPCGNRIVSRRPSTPSTRSPG